MFFSVNKKGQTEVYDDDFNFKGYIYTMVDAMALENEKKKKQTPAENQPTQKPLKQEHGS